MRITKAIQGRFWKFVKKTKTCWEWTGGRYHDGTGAFALKSGIPARAHRVSYQIANGAIPKDAYVRQDCTNPGCVRPEHLILKYTKGSKPAVRRLVAAKSGFTAPSRPAVITAPLTASKKIKAAVKAGTALAQPSNGNGHGNGKSNGKSNGNGHVRGGNACRLTPQQVLEIRALAEVPGVTHSDLGRRYGVTPQNVDFIVSRATWKNI